MPNKLLLLTFFPLRPLCLMAQKPPLQKCSRAKALCNLKEYILKPQYTCPECGTGFSDQTAYCENWRDKERKFGCPNCKTFFSIGLSEIENKQKPILAALIFTAILALAMYAIDVSLWGYVFVLVVGHQSYYLAAKFFEGNPKTVLTPITGPKNA